MKLFTPLIVFAVVSVAHAQQREAPLTSLDTVYVNRTVSSGLGTQASPRSTSKLVITPNGTSAWLRDEVEVNGLAQPGLEARGALTSAEVAALRATLQAARIGAAPAQVSGPARDRAAEAFELLVTNAPVPYSGRVRGLSNAVYPRYSGIVGLNRTLNEISERLRRTQASETHGFTAVVYSVGSTRVVIRASGEIVLRERVFYSLFMERSGRLFPAQLGQLGFDLRTARVGDLPAQVSLPGSRGRGFSVLVAAPGDLGGAISGVLGPTADDFQLSLQTRGRLLGLLLHLERLKTALVRGSMRGGVRVRFTR